MARAKSMELKERIRATEATRVTIIQCRDMLGSLREKLPIVFPDDVDPHGMIKSWLETADRNLAMLVEAVVEREEFL